MATRKFRKSNKRKSRVNRRKIRGGADAAGDDVIILPPREQQSNHQGSIYNLVTDPITGPMRAAEELGERTAAKKIQRTFRSKTHEPALLLEDNKNTIGRKYGPTRGLNMASNRILAAEKIQDTFKNRRRQGGKKKTKKTKKRKGKKSKKSRGRK